MADRYATQVLDAGECWQLVSRAVVGRIAVCIDDRAQIFPVNFVRDGDAIVFRTAAGTKLAAARNHGVAFEIDGYEAAPAMAWSVIIAGTAREIDSGSELAAAHELPLFPWHVAPKGHFVRIAADEISGRRFHAPYAGPSGFQRESRP